MGNEEKMEATVKQESYDIAAITETWCITGVLQWIALNSSERISKEKDMVRYPYMLGSVSNV